MTCVHGRVNIFSISTISVFHKTCHIMFTLHIYDLTFILQGRGDGGGGAGEEAASACFNICKFETTRYF